MATRNAPPRVNNVDRMASAARSRHNRLVPPRSELSTIHLASARAALPRGSYYQLVGGIEPLASQLDDAGDSLRLFVGGRTGTEPGLVGLGERWVVWRSVPEHPQPPSTVTLASASVRRVLLSTEETHDGLKTRDLTILGRGLLIELLKAPAAAASQAADRLERMPSRHAS